METFKINNLSILNNQQLKTVFGGGDDPGGGSGGDVPDLPSNPFDKKITG